MGALLFLIEILVFKTPALLGSNRVGETREVFCFKLSRLITHQMISEAHLDLRLSNGVIKDVTALR